MTVRRFCGHRLRVGADDPRHRSLLRAWEGADHVVRPDGSDPIAVDGYGYHPTWSSDGRQLIYIQDAASAAWRLLKADAAGAGEPVTVVDSVAISSARSFPAAEQFTWQAVEP